MFPFVIETGRHSDLCPEAEHLPLAEVGLWVEHLTIHLHHGLGGHVEQCIDATGVVHHVVEILCLGLSLLWIAVDNQHQVRTVGREGGVKVDRQLAVTFRLCSHGIEIGISVVLFMLVCDVIYFTTVSPDLMFRIRVIFFPIEVKEQGNYRFVVTFRFVISRPHVYYRVLQCFDTVLPGSGIGQQPGILHSVDETEIYAFSRIAMRQTFIDAEAFAKLVPVQRDVQGRAVVDAGVFQLFHLCRRLGDKHLDVVQVEVTAARTGTVVVHL